MHNINIKSFTSLAGALLSLQKLMLMSRPLMAAKRYWNKFKMQIDKVGL